MPEKITSRKNPLVLSIACLCDKKQRDERSLFFTEGKKLYFEGIQALGKAEYIFVCENTNINIAQKENVYIVTREVYMKMSQDSSPDGILCVWKKPVHSDAHKGFYLILENLQDPGNVGTVLRSAAAFGASGVVLCGCADPFGPKAVKACMGAIFKEPVYMFDTIDDAVSFARQNCDAVYAACLDKNAGILHDSGITKNSAVMIGNEGKGLTQQAIHLCDACVYIPILNMESLNAASAASIVLYDILALNKK